MELAAVRTFVAVADALAADGRFQDAADDLGVTQQAVSKRIAALERELGARLLTRAARGTRLTADGAAFLAPARDLLAAADRAVASVRGERRALRVDVVGSRVVPAALVQDFHDAEPDVALDVVTLPDAAAAIGAVRAGTVDAAFRAVGTRLRLPPGVVADRVLDEPIVLVTGAGHPLARAGAVTLAQLAGHRIWMPGLVPGSEWAAFYADLAAAFGLDLDASGPNFGTETLLDKIAGATGVATFAGDRTRLDGVAGRLVRVAVRDPVPVYPHALVHRRDDRGPALAALRRHLAAARLPVGAPGTWTPPWT